MISLTTVTSSLSESVISKSKLSLVLCSACNCSANETISLVRR
ncbi:Uncharacterised protein [Vibrio cholerae]|nr:Uncharacterised protein [Vibrio cholerae]CSI53687.1 Uncharacterised protein [Vibrio cholerae]